MTREHAKAMLPIITAFANGERVQWQGKTDGWITLVNPDFLSDPSEYRIAPKSEDAEWLRNEATALDSLGWETDYNRMRAIADKLEKLEAAQ